MQQLVKILLEKIDLSIKSYNFSQASYNSKVMSWVNICTTNPTIRQYGLGEEIAKYHKTRVVQLVKNISFNVAKI